MTADWWRIAEDLRLDESGLVYHRVVDPDGDADYIPLGPIDSDLDVPTSQESALEYLRSEWAEMIAEPDERSEWRTTYYRGLGDPSTW